MVYFGFQRLIVYKQRLVQDFFKNQRQIQFNLYAGFKGAAYFNQMQIVGNLGAILFLPPLLPKYYIIIDTRKAGKGSWLSHIQNTGRWNFSALASRLDPIYLLGFYVLISFPSLQERVVEILIIFNSGDFFAFARSATC